MATVWLSKVLSASKRVTCFHGRVGDVLRLYPVLSRLEQISADENKFAGVVHLSATHGVSAFATMKKKSGAFVALLRNPIEVANSQCIEKSKDPDAKQRYLAWFARAGMDWIAPENAVFARTVVGALSHYFDCAWMHDDRVFLFEDHTTKYSEVARLLLAVSQGEITADTDVERAFREIGPINHHHSQPLSWEDIFYRQWDDGRRAVFTRLYRLLSESVAEPVLKAPLRYVYLRELCYSKLL